MGPVPSQSVDRVGCIRVPETSSREVALAVEVASGVEVGPEKSGMEVESHNSVSPSQEEAFACGVDFGRDPMSMADVRTPAENIVSETDPVCEQASPQSD